MRTMRGLFFIILGLSISSCLVVNTTYDKLPPGTYRGVFMLDGRQSERIEPDKVAANFNLTDIQKGELPIQFELSYDQDSSMLVTFLNDSERITFNEVKYERLLSTARDSVTMIAPLNDTYITGYHEDGIIEGHFVDLTRDDGNYRIPFVAEFGVGYRFTDLRKTPTADLSGKWEVLFSIEDETGTYPAIAEFVQEGNHLSGTFLTETGDYRYLEGTVQADRAYLSTFDGSHVFLFSAKLQDDGSLLGIFRSGSHYQTIWSAFRNPNAQLANADTLTKVTVSSTPVSISGIGLEGQPKSTDDELGKIQVITLFGSWCPNCMDEAVFLDSLRNTLPSDQVAFSGFAFEKFRDTTRALQAVARFKERLSLGYDLAVTGFSSNKRKATETLGFLDELRSFPTLLVLNRKGEVVYTHTGFAGPATSEYGNFTKAFAKTIETQLNQ